MKENKTLFSGKIWPFLERGYPRLGQAKDEYLGEKDS